MAITFTPIATCADTQPFAECEGVDLSQPLDRETVETIRSGLLRHGLLLFRGQQAMTPEDEVAFNKAFGWHDDTQRADQELVKYQEALESWRGGQYGQCVDRFTGFLQAFPSSGYADDAAYWLADCTFKNDEYKRAVIRFADVVRVYPDSPKAPDALYRQGESLLKLGPRFKDAARTVFKRLQTDYPDSERASEATRQLERLGPSANSAN